MDLPLRNRSIVCISSIDWGFLWQSHQDIMSRFAAGGNAVTFIENTGVRSVGLRDLRRLLARLARWLDSTTDESQEPYPGVRVISPLLLPFPRNAAARWINEKVLAPRLARSLAAHGVENPIIFTYLPTRNALALIRHLRGPDSRVIYYCIADFHELTDARAEIAASERQLVAEADAVFVQGDALLRRFAPLTSELHDFHVGINLDVFNPDRAIEPARELRGLPRPIVGYSGGLHRHVDFELLRSVARAVPHGSLVLVGPVQADASALLREPNVHLLGHRPFTELPSYVAAFDVGLIPYARSVYTETVYPTKLFEYLALGVPVVGTDLPELVRLGLPAVALRIAPASGFVEAVASALSAPEGPTDRSVRRNLAREHGWDRIVREMAATIARLPAKRR